MKFAKLILCVILSLCIGSAFAEPVLSMNNAQREQNQLDIQKQRLGDNARISEEPLVFEKLSQNVYIAKKHGANSGLVVGKDELLLIESKGPHPGASKKLLEAVRTISDKPIKYVINTHSHFDHSGGNAFFAQLGATVIAQEYYRYTPITHHARFDKKLSLTIGDEEVVAIHTPTHTLDSTVIYLPNSNILFMGDNYSSKWLLYEGAHGGAGYRHTYNLAMSLADDKTIVVPGHGDIGSKADLVRNAQARAQLKQRMADLYAKGFNVIQMSKDKQLQDILAAYKGEDNKGTPVHLRTLQDLLDADFVAPFDVPPAVIKDYPGQYRAQDGQITEVVLIDGRLVARQDGQFIAKLKAVSNSRFDLVGFPYTQSEQIEFIKNPMGQTTGLKLVMPHRFVMNNWIKAGESVKVVDTAVD